MNIKIGYMKKQSESSQSESSQSDSNDADKNKLYKYHPSIWANVVCENMGDDYTGPTLYDKKEIGDIFKSINPENYDIIAMVKRRLPQLDYHYEPMYVTDITFRYKEKYYIIYADIVCFPSISGKWYRYIEDFFPGIIEINKTDLSSIRIPDSEVELVNGTYECELDFSGKNVCNDGECQFCIKCNWSYELLQDVVIISSDEYIKGIKDKYYHYDNGYERLRYYDQPNKDKIGMSNGIILPSISLSEKFNKWKSDYNYRKILPENEFDLLCFCMLIYNNNLISSGK